ncbi:hypothetical protein KIN20_027584 [Parelaphostrongylus tenuis]|uniref:Uncharacterized protein n=1 Tax=Parelaphostrongylus tenuis TaxID=148309 RepID=A0AAD5WDX8_PARTN|nr:hypothetical protein KIN20_027584 [Parelaphostrongylus tenuis]
MVGLSNCSQYNPLSFSRYGAILLNVSPAGPAPPVGHKLNIMVSVRLEKSAEKAIISQSATSWQSHVGDACRDYAPENSNNSSQLPLTSDAIRIVHDQLGKVYIAEASLLKNLEECNNPLDLEHVIDGLNRLRVVEMEIQRLLLTQYELLRNAQTTFKSMLRPEDLYQVAKAKGISFLFCFA